MKTSFKIILSSLVLFLTVSVFGPGMKCEAATPSCAKSQTVYLTKSDVLDGEYYLDYTELSSFIFIKNLASNAKIISIKSSNKNISGSNGLKWEGFPGSFVSLTGTDCKPGQKSTITIKVKQNSKTYKLTCKIVLKLKPTNFKTFSIGGKNYASKLTGYSGTAKVANLKIEQMKGTFKIRMKSGIKLKEVKLLRTSSNGKTTTKIIKNGNKVSLKKGDVLQISYTYTKKPKNYNFSYSGPAGVPSLYTLLLGGITIINVE